MRWFQRKRYPLFVPPEPLGTRKPWEWAPGEADTYAAWLHEVRPHRVAALAEWFGVRPDQDPRSLLDLLDGKAADAIVEPPFCEDGELTNAGHALGADMGLLLAAALEQERPDLRWEIVRKPRSAHWFQEPVLVGLWPGPFNPISMGVTQALILHDRAREECGWARLLPIWLREKPA